MRVSVQLLPRRVPVPADAVAVVIDVLRATTTLTVALANGAARVIPAASPAEATAIAEGAPGSLRCGERGGRTVPGFELGNSPAEFTAERVGGRTLVFASSNGSIALIHAAGARERVLAALVNASAVVEHVRLSPHVVIVCAGMDGSFSLEDTVCAGWIARRLAVSGAALDDTARAAAGVAPESAAELRTTVEGSANGRALRRLGADYARDVAFCATLDAFPRVFALPRD